MSPKPTGRARRALKQEIEARKEKVDAPSEHGYVVSVATHEGLAHPLLSLSEEEIVAQLDRIFAPPAPQPPPIAPARPSPPHPPRRPELDAWDSPSGPRIIPCPPPDPVHPAHLLRPEQWLLLELITTGMNAAVDAQSAYDSAYSNSTQMKVVARRILDFRVTAQDTHDD